VVMFFGLIDPAHARSPSFTSFGFSHNYL
jgi:hypothetical protein